MDSPSPTPTNNIVAVAISNANISLSPVSSPKVTNVPIGVEMSPQPPHIPMAGSPATRVRSSPQKMPSTESMEITEHSSAVPSRVLIRQRSQESDAPNQRSMDATQSITPAPFATEEGDETVVMRTDGKDPHLVTVTPPTNPYPATSVNGDNRMPHFLVCTSSADKGLMTTPVHMGMPFISKTESIEAEARPKPKDDTTYPITCGNNKAELVWKKFICPGINAKCVKCGDNWFTPKEFVNFAGKSTLKDWKRAIRIHGVMLRKMIEMGDLNYYEHETNCSNQCRSNKSFDNSCDKVSNSFESDIRDPAKEHSLEYVTMRSSSEELPHIHTNKKLTNYHVRSQESASSLPASQSLERSSSEDSGLAASPHLDSMLLREAPVTVEKIQDLNNFWNGILRMELFDDIIRDVVIQVTNLQARTKNNGTISIEGGLDRFDVAGAKTKNVVMMTNLVNSLEMIPNISSKMASHKRKFDRESEESSHTIHELEKKLAEQRKYDQDLKRKSQHLENVMSLTPNEKRQKRILRICRQKAVDTRIPPHSSGSSSSPIPSTIRDNVMLASAQGRAGIGQRTEFWPQTIQVDHNARAASSQMARMNVSGSSAPSAMSAIPSFAIFSPSVLHPNPEVFASPTINQAFVTSQAHHPPRDNAPSPKK